MILRLDGRYIKEKARAISWNLKNLKNAIRGRRKNLSLGDDKLRVRVSALVRQFLSKHFSSSVYVHHDSKAIG